MESRLGILVIFISRYHQYFYMVTKANGVLGYVNITMYSEQREQRTLFLSFQIRYIWGSLLMAPLKGDPHKL